MPAPIFFDAPGAVSLEAAARPVQEAVAPRAARRKRPWGGAILWVAVVLVGGSAAAGVLAFGGGAEDLHASDAPMLAAAPVVEIAPDALPASGAIDLDDSTVAAANAPARVAARTPPVVAPAAENEQSADEGHTAPPRSTSEPARSLPVDLVLPAPPVRRVPDVRLPTRPEPAATKPPPLHRTPAERTPIVQPKPRTRVPVLVRPR